MNLTISERFLICALQTDGSLPILSMSDNSTAAAGLIDLGLSEIITMEETIQVIKSLPAELQHLKILYDFLNEKERSAKSVLTSFSLDNLGQQREKYVNDISESLVHKGIATKVERNKLFFKVTNYPVNESSKNQIVEELRAEILEGEPLTEENCVLAFLLSKSGLLNDYFSKHEAEQFKSRLKEIEQSPSNADIKKAIEFSEFVITLLPIILGNM